MALIPMNQTQVEKIAAKKVKKGANGDNLHQLNKREVVSHGGYSVLVRLRNGQ